MSRLLSTAGDVFEGSKEFFGKVFGTAGITIVICILSVLALLLFWELCKFAIKKAEKKKFYIKWWALLLLVVDIVLLIYFCMMY